MKKKLNILKMFRKLINPSVLLAAAPVAAAAKEAKTPDESNKPITYRPQDLPIYSTVHKNNSKSEPASDAESSIIHSSIESGVKVVREFGCASVNAVKDKKKPVDDFIATGIGHSQFAFDYLNQPANGIHRTAAIAVGAISGYIIAIRRGFFRRLLYTSIGGLGVASICYPKEAEQYWQQSLNETKTYATILYNFAYGVKPGDEPKPLPNLIPDNLKETYGKVKGYFTSDKK